MDTRDVLIDRARHPQFAGHLAQPTHQAQGENLSCGDEIAWKFEVRDGTITNLAHTGRACTICLASADLLAEHLVHQPSTKVEQITSTEVTQWLGLSLSPTRLKCALLPLQTAKQALTIQEAAD